MDCRELRDRLSPFLDGELDPVASREVERHLAACPECAAALARRRELGEALRQSAPYERAPERLRQLVLSDARAAVRRPSPPSRNRRLWSLAAAALVAVALAAGVWRMAASLGGDALTHEAVSSHVRSLMASHLTDVVSTDRHTVKPWFAGKLDFSPPVADFPEADFRLIGGRLDYLGGRAVAALVYRHRRHVLNVFVWPAAGARSGVAAPTTEQGFHAVRAGDGRMAYLLVSDLNADELAGFARRLLAASSAAP